MPRHLANSRRIGAVAISLALVLGPAKLSQTALSQEAPTVKLTLKNHRFEPAEPHAAANKAFTIEVTNLDGTPAEFESKTLRVEKVIAANSTVSMQIRALAPGRYRFFDDYHEDTTEGFLVVQ
ncbi:MAG: cupredoxin domain-containing protein [Hyphomicrobiales bacterium]|nr:cupredoxin domain-containing protein [Hyphomicrobiales bacterium]